MIKITVGEKLELNGYDDTIIFSGDGFEFNKSFIGVSLDGRAIYDYDLMLNELMELHNWDIESASDWLNYNTIRALNYMGSKAPIIIERL